MSRQKFFLGNVLGVAVTAAVFMVARTDFEPQKKALPPARESKKTISPTPTVAVKSTPASYVLPSHGFISQTFNNCGPATLSMVLSYYGKTVHQDDLGARMRPYQHPTGDNDDKSIFADEFEQYAQEYGFEALARPNGTIEMLQELVANDIPVVVRTWLHPNEDIGHFRIVRGYDGTRRVLIQDDSYEGKDLEFDYDEFSALWQAFNYGYILVYPPAKQDIVRSILGQEFDESIAYKNSVDRAKTELAQNPHSSYSQFNLSTAYYHLGKYEQAAREFEKVEHSLPWRMLWYQIEPIAAYTKLGNAERVFALTGSILNNNNRAFSELYQLRGEVYLKQGNADAARSEFEQAIFYNKNFEPAKDALKSLEN